ncbi:MAG: hypothetical protein NTY15_15700 [Planctomycetota bacterium]|nr:hypothetical protein [Planctomycetota bacterium]
MKKSLWLPLAAGALLVTGCGTKPDVAKTGANESGSTTVATAGKASVAPSDPKEVVRLFLDSMRQGNGTQLSMLLSTLAREEIKSKQLEIAPLGSPMATFQIQNAVQEGDGMLVESTWTEPEQAGQPATELDVVWELRKEPAGWRICGMAVDPKNGDEVQIVNFEKLEPEQPPAQDPQRVASLPNGPTGFPANTNTPVGQNNQPQQPAGSFPPATGNNLPAANMLPAGNYGPGPTGFQPNQPNQPTNLPARQPAGGLPQPAGNFGASNQLPPIVPGNSPLPAANSQPASGQLRR